MESSIASNTEFTCYMGKYLVLSIEHDGEQPASLKEMEKKDHRFTSFFLLTRLVFIHSFNSMLLWSQYLIVRSWISCFFSLLHRLTGLCAARRFFSLSSVFFALLNGCWNYSLLKWNPNNANSHLVEFSFIYITIIYYNEKHIFCAIQ